MRNPIILSALFFMSACGSGEIEEAFNTSFYDLWDNEISQLPRPTVVPEVGTASVTSVLRLETPDGVLQSVMPITLDFEARSGQQLIGYAENFVIDGQQVEGAVALDNGTIFPFSTASTVESLADGKGNINSSLYTEIPITLPDGKLVNLRTALFSGGFVGDLEPSHILLEDDNAPGWYGSASRLLTPDADQFEINAQLRGAISAD